MTVAGGIEDAARLRRGTYDRNGVRQRRSVPHPFTGLFYLQIGKGFLGATAPAPSGTPVIR